MSSFIHWDGSLELDHAIIDEDHRDLSETIGRVVDAVGAPCPKGAFKAWRARIDATLAELRRDIETHFRSEEWIMEAAAYPKIGAHRVQHRILLDELDAFAARDLAPDAESNQHAVRFLHEWFETHVRIWDRALVRWLDSLSPERA